jgi:hypothetical protein
VQELGHDEVGDRVVDRLAEEDDALVEQPGEDVELALAARGPLDHRGDQGHRPSLTGAAAAAAPRASPARRLRRRARARAGLRAAPGTADRLEEPPGRLALVDDRVGAGDPGAHGVGRLGGRGGVDHDARRPLEVLQAPAVGKAVRAEELGIDDHDVDAPAREQGQALLLASGAADRHEPGLGAQQDREPGADGGCGSMMATRSTHGTLSPPAKAEVKEP